MKQKTGYSLAGIVVFIAILAFLAMATFLIIDSNKKSTNFSSYDFNSIITGDEHNGNITDHVKAYDKETKTIVDNPALASEALIVLYEYADFQCEYCAMMNTRVNAILEAFKGEIAVVYRNYLLSYHQNGTAAASAAEAAGLQGYWKAYADELYSNQAEWRYAVGSERTALFNKYFETVSSGAGDIEKFNSDLTSTAISEKISFDMGIGKRIDIAGTPSFYIEGQNIAISGGGSVNIADRNFVWEESLTTEGLVNLLDEIIAAKKELQNN